MTSPPRHNQRKEYTQRHNHVLFLDLRRGMGIILLMMTLPQLIPASLLHPTHHTDHHSTKAPHQKEHHHKEHEEAGQYHDSHVTTWHSAPHEPHGHEPHTEEKDDELPIWQRHRWYNSSPMTQQEAQLRQRSIAIAESIPLLASEGGVFVLSRSWDLG